jgi:hypothetical protein
MLLAPLPTAIVALLSILDGDVRRCFLVASWVCPPTAGGWAKIGRLIVVGVLGGNAAQPLGGVPKAIDRCPERWR